MVMVSVLKLVIWVSLSGLRAFKGNQVCSSSSHTAFEWSSFFLVAESTWKAVCLHFCIFLSVKRLRGGLMRTKCPKSCERLFFHFFILFMFMHKLRLKNENFLLQFLFGSP